MPELPEVETIARDLEGEVSGSTIAAVEVSKRDVLRVVGATVLKKRTTGATIARCWRRAKLVVMDLSTGDRLVMSLRFTGGFRVSGNGNHEAAEDLKYSCVRWILKDGRTLHYIEVRRLGTVALMTPKQWDRYASKLGVEPLEKVFTPDLLFSLL